MRTVFYEKMRADVERKLTDANRQCEVILKTMTKRNDVKMTGLMILTEGDPVSPILYLDEFYDQYRDGRSYADILNRVVSIFHEAKAPEAVTEEFMKFDQIKDRVFLQVADLKQNQNWLEDKVYHVVDDLACTYHLWIEVPGYEGSIPIRHEHLEAWGVTAEEVRAVAESNLLQENVQFRRMNDILKEFLTDTDDENLLPYADDFPGSEKEGMYVLKTDRDSYGANILLRKDVMEYVGERLDGDYYILPSSQHEVIVLPVNYAPSFDSLQLMIKEINKEEVEPQDRLSDDLFYYDREGDRVMKAKYYFAEKLGISKEEMDSDPPEKKRYRDEPER